jgi:hypothetical protein
MPWPKQRTRDLRLSRTPRKFQTHRGGCPILPAIVSWEGWGFRRSASQIRSQSSDAVRRVIKLPRTNSSLHSRVCRISNPQSSHPSKRSNLMLLRPRHTQNVFHNKIPHQQSVRNQRPMAPPRHRLSAHNRRRLSSRQLLQTRQSRKKLIRLHIIRKSSKTRIVPTHIRRIRLRMTQPSQLFQMQVSNPRSPQMPRQSFPIELRVVPRTWNTPHIHHALYAMRPQHLNKFGKRPRRMSNRKNRSLHFFSPHAHLGSQNTFRTGSTSSVPILYHVCPVFAALQC